MTLSLMKCEHARTSEENLAVPSVSISGYKIMLATKKRTGVGHTIANVITGEGLRLLSMIYAGGVRRVVFRSGPSLNESDGAEGRVCLLRLDRASLRCFSDFFSLLCEIWGSPLEMSGEKMLSQNDV